ncbi:MAG: acyltransferase [Klebsiella aerogenes]|uniref:acyltransferase family protein n=1 Tax=Klebsiella aerogenes TaxID=548 RepID=UPI002277709D|nr:acyltransferase [Klebsiella aerogenes]MCR1574280.1 acyltransferase [Klebsiella aerogenes]MCY4762981.1 acyltransferase [Klebsiella aerogenes]
MINNIQMLRALAVIMVVAYHSVGVVNKYGFGLVDYSQIGRWGALGVDIFFVISGFIMAMIDDKKRKSPYEFAKDRVLRIVPIYWLMIITLIVIQSIMPEIFRDTIYTTTQNIASIFFVSSYFGFNYPTLYVGWSLELEMFFYAAFSLCLIIKNQKAKLVSLIGIILVLSMLGLIKPISMEFAFGIIAYYTSKKISSMQANILLLLSATLIAIALFYSLSIPTDLYSIERPLFAGLISFAIVFTAVVCRDVKNNFMTEVGNASYSIYLVQVFSIPLITKIVVKLDLKVSGLIVFLVATIFTVIAGYIFYILIEKNVVNVSKGLRMRQLNKV